jgi:hypothetical protein
MDRSWLLKCAAESNETMFWFAVGLAILTLYFIADRAHSRHLERMKSLRSAPIKTL